MIFQIVPDFYQYDAISQHAVNIQTMLNELGIKNTLCARNVHPPELRTRILPVQKSLFTDDGAHTLLFHFSIYTPLIEELADIPCRKVMIYHNITPARFFQGLSNQAFTACERGRHQLKGAAGIFDLALAVSAFNAEDLKAAGYARTGVLPLVVNTNVHDDGTLRSLWLESEKTTLLHVGKWAPNKKIEDLVKTFYFYHKINPESRLVLVGRNWEWENYTQGVIGLIHKLGLWEDIRIISQVLPENLAALYRASDVYVSMSEHEGFCVPLIEAMASHLPVVAYKAGAVSETIQDAGVLAHTKNFAELAEVIHTVVTRPSLKTTLIEKGAQRARAFSYPRVLSQLQEMLPLIQGKADN